MLTNIFISKSKNAIYIVLFWGFLQSKNTSAQNPMEFGLVVSPGYTAVNFEKAIGYSDDYMDDWDQFYLSIHAKAYLPSQGKFQIGAEVGWNKLYYAYYRVPYGTYPLYYEFYISTTSLMLSGRYSMNNFFIAGKGGLHIFDNGVALAMGGEAGIKLNVTDNINIPLSACITPVFGDGTPISISLGLGLVYRLSN